MIWLALAIAAGIILYFAYGLHVSGLLPLPRNIGQYFDEPEERLSWGIRLLASAFGVAGFVDLVGYGGTLFYNAFSVEMIVGAVTVLFLDELNRLRSKAEDKKDYKKLIIQQMRSPSKDLALDAARIAKDEGWLEDGSLRGVNLRLIKLQGANLEKANLQGAILWEADLQGVRFSGANLQGANLVGTNMQGVWLWGANLQGANLNGADLQGAALRGADLQGADLRGANLQGARLKRAKLKGAKYDHQTTWQDGFDPIASGAILVTDLEGAGWVFDANRQIVVMDYMLTIEESSGELLKDVGLLMLEGIKDPPLRGYGLLRGDSLCLRLEDGRVIEFRLMEYFRSNDSHSYDIQVLRQIK